MAKTDAGQAVVPGAVHPRRWGEAGRNLDVVVVMMVVVMTVMVVV